MKIILYFAPESKKKQMWYILFSVVVIILLFLFIQKRKCLQEGGLRVFMYHHIGKESDVNTESFFVSEETFAQQLELLAKEYHPVSLSEVEDCYINRKNLPHRAVLLTFDDGYANNYIYAYPLALEKWIPFTVFLSTGQIGVQKEMLTWKQVKEMDESGLVEFASHGVSHKRLRKYNDEDVFCELTESKAELEARLGKQVKSFCYPYGAFDKRIRKLVFNAGYIMDFGTRKGINTWPWRGNRPLLRAHVMRDDNLKDFQNQLKTGHEKGIWSCF